MAHIKVVGLDKLEKALKENVTMNDVKKVVRHNGAQLQDKIQQNADFTQGYQTGTTKRSVNLEIKDGGFTADSGPTTEYASYLEYGTRFMDAQPFVKPAHEAQTKKFESDMKKLVR
jgi:HK97 gp10 family phage protein